MRRVRSQGIVERGTGSVKRALRLLGQPEEAMQARVRRSLGEPGPGVVAR